MTGRLAAEFIGTLLLLATVVGSGIMGERLAEGNDAIALLGNSIATGAMLVVLILVFGGISGAHFNPAVTLAFLLRGDIALWVSISRRAIGSRLPHRSRTPPLPSPARSPIPSQGFSRFMRRASSWPNWWERSLPPTSFDGY